MQVDALPIAGAKLITPRRVGDARGYFSETYTENKFAAAGIPGRFVQDNEAWSAEVGTLRGLHCQLPPHAQAKLVRVVRGRIRDAIVDARVGSPSFGQSVTLDLDSKSGAQAYVPAGCLHGYVTLEPDTLVAYKVDAFYDAPCDRSIAWNDPDLAVDWKLGNIRPVLSERDQTASSWADFNSPFVFGGPDHEGQ